MALQKTHAQFREALRIWEEDDKAPYVLLTIRALWWFIENVSPDDSAREAIYWELRGMIATVEA